MVTGPNDLPDRRESGDDATFDYTPAFDEALAALIPGGVERFYFKRDGIEFRLSRALELQQITPHEGYLITEAHFAGVPECIIWFRIGTSADGQPRYTLDHVQVRPPPYEEEDDT